MQLNDAPAPISTAEHRISHPQGAMHAQSWWPTHAPNRGAPIVLFHDSLGSVALWRDFPAALAAASGRRVIAYDRLGFGRSDARRGRPHLDFIGDEARTYFPALCGQLELDRYVAFGHSVGGGMAIHCAAEDGACEALITVAAQVFVEDRTLAGIRDAFEQFQDPAQLQRLARYHGDKAPWVFDAWTGCWLDPAFAGWSLAEVLPRVRCPVLAIHGDLDEFGSPRHPRMICERVAGPSQLAVLPDIHHVPHREDPAQVLALVSAFLAAADTP